MKKYAFASLGIALLSGCNNIETALTVMHAAAPDDQCAVKAEGTDFLANVQFDATGANTLGLALRVTNNLVGGTQKFGSDSDSFTLPNSVTPQRFDLRWECDSNGFSDDVGDLYLPQFSTTEPFCVANDTREFVGFDVVPASGNAIAPGEIGIAFIRPIPAQLGQAFADVFELARKAQDCCDSTATGSCDDASLQAAPSGPGTACGDLQTTFDVIAGPNKLSATSYADLQKFRPFLIYDHVINPPKTGQLVGPSYQLRLRGVLEGVTGDGSVVSSTEFTTQIGICAHCSSTPCTQL